MIFEIDQDGAVALPPPPRPLVHTNDLRSRGRRCGGRPHQPQQGIGTGPPLTPARQPGACLTTEGKAAGEEALGEAQGPSCLGSRHRGQPFRENLAWARGMVAEKLPHPQLQAHGKGSPRQIGKGACIPAVDP